MTLSGFWSYVHADDDAEGGRIADLARDIVEQYTLLTGDAVELFLDRDSLEWGARWNDRIGSSLDSVAFFVPVLTPRYFQSAACRAEFQRFVRQADATGVGGLILPILYVDPTGLPSSDDELLQMAKDHQWVDWSDLRFEDRSSTPYRRAVHQLAQRLVQANRAAEEAALARATSTSQAEEAGGTAAAPGASDEDDDPGTLERLAGLEDALPQLTSYTEALSADVNAIGRATEGIQTAAESRPGGLNTFASRLALMRSLAVALEEPVTSLDEHSKGFSQSLHTMDLGVRAVLEYVSANPDDREDTESFFTAIRGLASAGDIALGQLESMSEQAAALEGMSREVRPIIRLMRDAISRITEGRALMNDWVEAIDSQP